MKFTLLLVPAIFLLNVTVRAKDFMGWSDSIVVTMPVSRIVYQRQHNQALIPVSGNCPANARAVQARLVPRVIGQGKSTKWITIDKDPVEGHFAGTINGKGGWYNLELRAFAADTVIASGLVERVGIGEVFIVVGHSVAQGGGINLEGATDDRVSTIALDEKLKVFDSLYLRTGDSKYLPDPVFVQATTSITPAPFGHGSYFWSKFGDLLAKKENVPVLIYNAGFGGTSLEHWAKSSQNIQFEHGFVKSGIRMPYINLYNTLKKYIPLTGVRALLADQGQNDGGEKDPEKIFTNYQTFVQQARKDLNDPSLAVVVNRQAPVNSLQVRTAQEKMIKEPFCFAGPDYDTFLKEDRYDGIHLSAAGAAKAAVRWADALDRQFFRKAIPWQPSWK